ncbi:MAG: GAF domain-containing protein [Proteobacteria bacterium]|nr:MAG: GAF domain-containing protein [Pseudomonadota bacterium]
MRKQKHYSEVYASIQSLLTADSDWLAAMATIVSELHNAFESFDWTGFYRVVRDDHLQIGPYQGSHGCLDIPFKRGVCGAAATSKKTQLVPDVEAFPGHIACSSATKSEIVVPVLGKKGEVLAVLDIDSNVLNDFDAVDQHWLESICQLYAMRYPMRPSV